MMVCVLTSWSELVKHRHYLNGEDIWQGGEGVKQLPQNSNQQPPIAECTRKPLNRQDLTVLST